MCVKGEVVSGGLEGKSYDPPRQLGELGVLLAGQFISLASFCRYRVLERKIFFFVWRVDEAEGARWR